MTKRIFRAIFWACLATLASGLLLTLGVLYRYYDARLLGELAARASAVSAGLEAAGEDHIDRIGAASTDRVTLIDTDGTVLYDNRAEAASMENHAARAEVAEALKTGSGHAERNSATLSQKTVYYALRLADGRVLRLAASQITVWALLAPMASAMLPAALILAAAAGMLAARLSRRIVQPLNRLDLDDPTSNDSYEELSPLLRRLDAQNRRIAAQMEELQRRQREFGLVADNMAEGLLMIDRKADVLFCNGSMTRFFGADDCPVGRSVLVLDRSEPLRRVVNEVLQGRHAGATLTLAGRSCELLANPVCAGEPAVPSGAVLLMLDVTEREERERLRREFTANVSHELKTPLTSIYGSSELLAAGLVQPADVQGFADDIHRESGRMIRLVEDILRLSQLDEGQLGGEKAPVDLYALAGQVLRETADAAAAAQVTLSLEGGPAVLQGVAPLLHELVANLCDNAVKYNVPGGSVRVRVEDGGAGHPRLTVQDTGIGIPKEDQARVFERFYRVDKSHSRRIGGTGLGLSIVKHAALLHGGTVSLTSVPGQGSTFTVQF